MTTMAASAAGRAILKLARNLSRIAQPCPLQAAIVVSEIKDRLSPNMAPPTTAPTQEAAPNPDASDTATAIGVSNVIVPTDVPMARDTNALTTNNTTTAYCAGISDSRQ